MVVEQTETVHQAVYVVHQEEVPLQDFEGTEEQSRVFVDADLDHERDQEVDGFAQLLELGVLLVQDLAHLLLPQGCIVEDPILRVRSQLREIQ